MQNAQGSTRGSLTCAAPPSTPSAALSLLTSFSRRSPLSLALTRLPCEALSSLFNWLHSSLS